jgi:hypothetical protein
MDTVFSLESIDWMNNSPFLANFTFTASQIYIICNNNTESKGMIQRGIPVLPGTIK